MADPRDKGRPPGRAWTGSERDFPDLCGHGECKCRIHKAALRITKPVIESHAEAQFSNRPFVAVDFSYPVGDRPALCLRMPLLCDEPHYGIFAKRSLHQQFKSIHDLPR
ncbi:hypothetical protein PhaeoP23_03975 (plasmid) [Phaeobacter piscinae]|uniref:Uncharacterized protein n=1 Tax=Phaeobacter piscinae TaxID=1580596 RepID=A0ABN5DNN8_9RHOB|nr:hypothetical protein PhaeoP36_04053 [Phaeobacter piscinae]AUQ88649.1 hypothetical protein PhaeoP42_04054 [Phaeobacter piscinae]AUQ92648.1 hypothetical protein PhaeoP24_04090 [Phaeobacter inhibens]AUR26454.1 hypothetical protein PhaeoP23_03975 [Phaeobacter piscinae]